ncbi:MAG: hypothetical protein IKF54_03580 [Eubacterium sp.]|nr:hypothetical protein [Eubacterium sp.]
MNSKKDKKQIVSYFCILFLLCGVHTISGIYREDTIPERVQAYGLEAEEDARGSQHHLTEGPLINDGTTVRQTAYRDKCADAVSSPLYSNERTYFGYGSMIAGVVIVPTILTIIAARHLLC